MFKGRKLLALLLSFTMIFINVFSFAAIAYADTEELGEKTAIEQEIDEAELVEEEPTIEETASQENETILEETEEEIVEPIKEAVEEESMIEVPEEETLVPEEGIEEPAEVQEEITEETENVQETQDVAFEEKTTLDGVEISVTADPGVFPEGSTLKVVNLTTREEKKVNEAIEAVAEEVEIAAQYTFDITVLDSDGNEIQPDTSKGTVNVAFKTDEVADDQLEAAVYHIDGETGEAEALDVATEGDVAVVETEGFSAYSLIFTHVDTGSGTVKTTTSVMWVGETITLQDLLASHNITGTISTAEADGTNIIYVYKDNGTWYVEARNADTRQHRITVFFTDGREEQILVTTHIHNWTATGSGTDTLKIKCAVDNCAFHGTEFTAKLTASDATYNGAKHGAEKHLTDTTSYWPGGDVKAGDIYYEGTGNTSYAKSTTAPTNAGTYKASFTVTPDGGSTYTVQKTYTIAKAEHNVTAPTARTLTYCGENQNLVNAGSSTTGTVYYSLNGGAWQTSVPTAMHAGTYTVSWHIGETANYKTYGPKNITVIIGKRPIWITGVTASNKVYDGTKVASVNTSNVVFNDRVNNDNLTVTVTGEFDTKNVGTGKTVSLSYVLGGKAVDDYFINTNNTNHQKTTTASISKKPLHIYWQGAGDNAYTGETIIPKASLRNSKNLTPTDGLAYTGDSISVTVQQKNNGKQNPSVDVETGYEAEVTGLTGGDSGNYSINPGEESVVYNIVKDLVVVNWDADSLVKQYNATAQIPEFVSGAELTGIKDVDKEYVSVKVKTEGKKDVGTYKMEAELVFASGHENLANDYTLDSSKETWFEITKAPLTVTPEGWIIYGEQYTEEAIHPSHTFTGFLGDDNEENSVTGTAAYRVDLHERFAPVGVQDVMKIDSNSLKSDNYDITFATGKLTVHPRPIKLEWYDETGKKVTDQDNRYTYDGTTHTLTAKVVGTDENDIMWYQMASGGQHSDVVKVATYEDNEHKDTNLKAEIHPDPYVAHALTLTGDGSQNYTLIADPQGAPGVEDPSAHQDWYIDPLRVILSWNIESLVYNAKDQWESVTAEVTNAIEGETVEVTEYNTVEAKNVAEYTKIAEKVSDDNYTLFYNKETLTGDLVESATHKWNITQAPLVVKATAWITYGETIDDVLSIKTDAAGVDYTYTTIQGDKLLEDDVDTDQIDFTNVEFTTTYNQFDDASYPGASNWDEVTGKSAYTMKADGLTSQNYEITYDDDNLVVYPKPVTLEWFEEDEETAAAAEGAEYTYDGNSHKVIAKVKEEDKARSEDEVSVETYTGNEEKDSNDKTAGEKDTEEKYTAKATKLTSENYTLLLDPKHNEEETTETDSQDYKILPLTAELKWKWGETIYNGKEQKNTVTVTNAVSGNEIKPTYSNPADPIAKDAKDGYETEVTDLGDLNYTLDGAEGTVGIWNIKPLPIKLKWNATSKVYNGAEQKITATIINLVSGDKASLTYNHPKAKDVGTYKTSVTKVSNANYTIEKGTGLTQSWKITQAPLTITAKAKTIYYGDKPANNGVTYSGFKGSDKASVLTGKLQYKYNYARYGKYGKYVITPYGQKAKNYKITYKTGVLTVKDKVTKLLAKGIAVGSTKAQISWNKVTGATKYEVWFAKCDSSGRTYPLKKIGQGTKNSFMVRNLEKNTGYKFTVVAKTKDGDIKSAGGHFVTGDQNGTKTNAKNLNLNKTSVSLKAGKTFQIKGTVSKAKSNLNLLGHTATLRYASTNKKVARVTANGKITAVGKGWCRIYVVTENGIWKTIEVTVK